jgi:hypothetical protein
MTDVIFSSEFYFKVPVIVHTPTTDTSTKRDEEMTVI